MSPLKAYEYIAAGLPVVSVDLEPMRLLHEHVRFAPTVAEFGPAIAEALQHGVLPESARSAFLAQNSWAARHEALFHLAFGSPSPA